MHKNDPITSAEAKFRVGLAKIWLTAKITGMAICDEPDIMACSL
jgi:hypothetical protein